MMTALGNRFLIIVGRKKGPEQGSTYGTSQVLRNTPNRGAGNWIDREQISNTNMIYMESDYDELFDYLEDSGFCESNYGTEDKPCIYWHHEKCPDILKLESTGVIVIYSLPIGIEDKHPYLSSSKTIETKEDVDRLRAALAQ